MDARPRGLATTHAALLAHGTLEHAQVRVSAQARLADDREVFADGARNGRVVVEEHVRERLWRAETGS